MDAPHTVNLTSNAQLGAVSNAAAAAQSTANNAGAAANAAQSTANNAANAANNAGAGTLSSNGYATFPGGLMLVWGTAVGNRGTGRINFSTAFPHSVFQVFTTDKGSQGSDKAIQKVVSPDSNGFSVESTEDNDTFSYFAIGR